MKHLLLVIAAAVVATPGNAQSVTDDFNRSDAANLGGNYTVQNGNFAISGNRAITSSFASLATLNGSSSTSASVDAALRGRDAGSYVALSFGFDPADQNTGYFIKVQDNDGDSFFETYGFYGANNNSEPGPFAFLNPFQAGTITASYVGTLATLSILSGSSTQTFSFNYGYALKNNSVGFGLNRQGVADNFTVTGGSPVSPVPEPATWAMMIGGFGMVGGAMRYRRRKTPLTFSAH